MQASDWIKCSERMPELVWNTDSFGGKESEEVLVWVARTDLNRGYADTKCLYNDGQRGEWWSSEGEDSLDLSAVTHWMPIVGPDDSPADQA